VLELVEDDAVLDLLPVPDVGVEHPVGLGGVGHDGQQLEHVALDLEFDAGEVVEDAGEPTAHRVGVVHREVDRLQGHGRVLLPHLVDVGEQQRVSDPGRASHAPTLAAVGQKQNDRSGP